MLLTYTLPALDGTPPPTVCTCGADVELHEVVTGDRVTGYRHYADLHGQALCTDCTDDYRHDHDDPARELDPHDPESWGLDVDALHDWQMEDRL